MGTRWKKLIAPIITTGLLVAYFVFFLVQGASIPLQGFGRFLGIAIPVGLMGVSVYVLIERVKEIRSGEEDDLGEY